MIGPGVCGIPLDAGWFDDSGLVDAPKPGATVEVARFRLPPQYCGVLINFAQYVEPAGAVATPGYLWQILADSNPLAPYTGFERIVNPWGQNAFPIYLRLPEAATVRLVVRNVGGSTELTRVGGRLMGHYWYNAAYGNTGDVERVAAWLRAAGLQPVAGR